MSAGKIPPKTDPAARSAYFREMAIARHANAAHSKDRRTYPPNSKIENVWMKKAVDLGRVTVDENGNATNMSRQSWRRLAKRLGDADTALRVRRITEPRPVAIPDDDVDLLLAHYQSEATRFRARAARDRQIAAEHDRLADRYEEDLAALMFRLGLVS